jgi:UDP-N-acetylmuramyl pentapeptide phosphotransferase/UDP-N-acetylglucosamine-1-phosphate transferase
MRSPVLMLDAARIESALVVVVPVLVAAATFTAGLIILSWPRLKAYALARPNARSSHRRPTPQGGGIAVVIAMLAVAWGAIALSPAFPQDQNGQFLAVSAAAVFLAVVGAIDDVRTLPAALRLALQCIAMGTVIAMLPNELQILPLVPWWLERPCLFLGGMWFVNLVNFMDGIDWITVAEVVPVTGAIVVLGLTGAIGPFPTVAAAALLGAMVGFAPFNKPVAPLFLGDVGSLPIGLVLGWLLLQLAGKGHLAAALILPLYYLADATITLARRIARREPFWQPHRTHFYQRAIDNGFTVPAIVIRVFLVNIVLAALALITVAVGSIAVLLAALVIAVAIVAWLLITFGRAKR